MATASKIKGFNVSCPFCRDSDAEITLNVNDLAECRCSGCDETFTPKQARDLAAAELARWERLVRWVELASDVIEWNRRIMNGSADDPRAMTTTTPNRG